jgi:peptide chain release factor subunit 3
MPISAQTTVGIKDRVSKDLAPWYDGPSLLEYLDNMKTLERKINAPFMMPINGKYRVRRPPARLESLVGAI